MTATITTIGTAYLEETMLPLILSINPKQTESHILSALGMDNRVSPQSILIAFGERIEQFWNKVLSDDSTVTNLIEESNLITVGKRQRQIDHLFKVNNAASLTYYLESKCNLNFDSEKIRASNEKINAVADAVGGCIAAYFVPVVATVPQAEVTRYEGKGMTVMGVDDLLARISAPFTSAEYFAFLREVVAPILAEKGL